MLPSVVLISMLGWSRFLLHNNLTLPEHPECSAGRDGRMQIMVTVPAVGPSRHVAVLWWGRQAREEDRIVLFDYDPTSQKERPLDVFRPSYSPGRSLFVSRLKLPSLEDRSYAPMCLVWAKYLADLQEDSRSCLQTQPNWMEINKHHLSIMSLSEAFIPGTHNSGSIALNSTSQSIVWNYIMSQDLSVLTQLLMGIRYLDLRVGSYTGDQRERFWIAHSAFKTATTLKTVLLQVKQFMERTNEIVILDFHRFPVGFELREAHEALWDFIVGMLGPHLMAPEELGDQVRLGTLWALNKRLVVCYNSKVRPRDPLLWHGIPHKWADARTGEELFEYIEEALLDPPHGLWAATATLTPTYKSALLNPFSGLRDLADKVGYNVSSWLRERWWLHANIVATDFFLSTAVVDVGILANIWKSYCPDRR